MARAAEHEALKVLEGGGSMAEAKSHAESAAMDEQSRETDDV